MNLVQVPTKHIEEVWHIVVKDIADALARSNGYALADHIKKWILEEKMQLWILWDQDSKEKYFGTVVTEVITRPLQRCLNIRIMTGKHREKWQHLIKHIEEFAWQNKCDLLELVARPGWKKILKPFGGNVNINDFRESFSDVNDYNYLKPPMISRYAHIEKINLLKNNSGNELVIKRSTPLKNSKNSLGKFIKSSNELL